MKINKNEKIGLRNKIAKSRIKGEIKIVIYSNYFCILKVVSFYYI